MCVTRNVAFGFCSPVAALAIDKVGPRPYHFRSGPTSGPTTRPGSQKSRAVERLIFLIALIARLIILIAH